MAADPLAAQSAPIATDPCLFGVWEVVRWTDLDREGKPVSPDRTGAQGRFVYTPGGNMSVQVMLHPDAAPIKGRQDVEGLAKAARDSIEYFGSYEADPETGALTHRIVGSGLPNRRGSAANRHYSIENGVLQIYWSEADGRRFHRSLRLMERLGDAACERVVN
ncbi:MAG: lipocalin-like domain-containing protein [Erythrobacter sp.]|jgi:hypothetical protein|nr:lipocalin-like domain-containing protein [Erythrobacter sp.]